MKIQSELAGNRKINIIVTFTIDCMPAYTKFNKKKKIMATLQVVDQTDTTHNYKNKDILGHENRTADSDVDGWYSKSVFSAEK